MNNLLLKVAFVQPIVGPVRELWFRKLAASQEINFCVFSLSATLSHRPGWHSSQDAGYCVKQLKSLLIPSPRRFSGNTRTDLARRLVPINLLWELFRFRPDVVLTTNATELLQALPVQWLFGSKIILLAEDTPLTYSRISKFRRWIKGLTYKLADAYAAHSSEARKLLLSLEIAEQRIGFTPWSVDIDKFSSGSRDFHDSSAIPENKMIFITIGALIPRKGINCLLEAWSQMSQDLRKNACLVILGTGPEFNHLMNFVRSNKLDEVIFAGHVDPSEVATWLTRADIFVFPTLEDIWGFVTSEAMAASLPLLCSKYAGCASDLVEEGVNGWIFDPLNREAFTQLLEKTLADRTKLAEMGKESNRIIKGFTVERSVTNLIEVLKRTVDCNSKESEFSKKCDD